MIGRRASRRSRAIVAAAPADETSFDQRTGAVRSLQAADLVLAVGDLDAIWSPADLERLARTYWRFLTRASAHLVSVRYREHERRVVALGFVPLLTFAAPEYEMDAARGLVRWRIAGGLLVAHAPAGGRGHLEIRVARGPALATDPPGSARLHVEVEVAGFHPAIATRLGRPVYEATQSRLHVFVTKGFLRSLARLDLAESRVGRFAQPPPPDGA